MEAAKNRALPLLVSKYARALRAFAKTFELEAESPENWTEAGRAFQK